MIEYGQIAIPSHAIMNEKHMKGPVEQGLSAADIFDTQTHRTVALHTSCLTSTYMEAVSRDAEVCGVEMVVTL